MTTIQRYNEIQNEVRAKLHEYSEKADFKQLQHIKLILSLIDAANKTINEQHGIIEAFKRYTEESSKDHRNAIKNAETWHKLGREYRRKLVELGYDPTHLAYTGND